MRVARLGDRASTDARAAGVFRRDEAEVRHQFTRVGESREVAELGDQRDRGDERHAAQGLESRDDGRPPPRRRQLTQLLREPLEPSLRFVDGVAILV